MTFNIIKIKKEKAVYYLFNPYFLIVMPATPRLLSSANGKNIPEASPVWAVADGPGVAVAGIGVGVGISTRS